MYEFGPYNPVGVVESEADVALERSIQRALQAKLIPDPDRDAALRLVARVGWPDATMKDAVEAHITYLMSKHKPLHYERYAIPVEMVEPLVTKEARFVAQQDLIRRRSTALMRHFEYWLSVNKPVAASTADQYIAKARRVFNELGFAVFDDAAVNEWLMLNYKPASRTMFRAAIGKLEEFVGVAVRIPEARQFAWWLTGQGYAWDHAAILSREMHKHPGLVYAWKAKIPSDLTSVPTEVRHAVQQISVVWPLRALVMLEWTDLVHLGNECDAPDPSALGARLPKLDAALLRPLWDWSHPDGSADLARPLVTSVAARDVPMNLIDLAHLTKSSN